MSGPQNGILAPLPPAARYLSFSLLQGADARGALRRIAAEVDGEQTVLGIGASLASALGRHVEGLTTFPSFAAAAVELPNTPAALWLWLRGEDRAALMRRERQIEALLADTFVLEHSLEGFLHRGGRDLTGYEDGTENPQGDDAAAAAIVAEDVATLAGSSFVAVQQWLHDFKRFDAMPKSMQDRVIGRERESNEELDDASECAHVKRTAQENFSPEAFVLRRSMAWIEGERAGLQFVAFGASFAAFEAQLKRMSGAEDGIVDGLFRFTRPLTGAYFWCPPMRAGAPDLRLLGV
ncbi:Dyp-type peroxidase [Niveibacterium sp.]|uniref:Dyp-type peroxidase n=1 Tax=Niveibacterium sp. TaxID=2017444 RepID=UPI0035AE8217